MPTRRKKRSDIRKLLAQFESIPAEQSPVALEVEPDSCRQDAPCTAGAERA